MSLIISPSVPGEVLRLRALVLIIKPTSLFGESVSSMNPKYLRTPPIMAKITNQVIIFEIQPLPQPEEESEEEVLESEVVGEE
jgi:hypothetical protein